MCVCEYKEYVCIHVFVYVHVYMCNTVLEIVLALESDPGVVNYPPQYRLSQNGGQAAWLGIVLSWRLGETTGDCHFGCLKGPERLL